MPYRQRYVYVCVCVVVCVLLFCWGGGGVCGCFCFFVGGFGLLFLFVFWVFNHVLFNETGTDTRCWNRDANPKLPMHLPSWIIMMLLFDINEK